MLFAGLTFDVRVPKLERFCGEFITRLTCHTVARSMGDRVVALASLPSNDWSL